MISIGKAITKLKNVTQQFLQQGGSQHGSLNEQLAQKESQSETAQQQKAREPTKPAPMHPSIPALPPLKLIVGLGAAATRKVQFGNAARLRKLLDFQIDDITEWGGISVVTARARLEGEPGWMPLLVEAQPPNNPTGMHLNKILARLVLQASELLVRVDSESLAACSCNLLSHPHAHFIFGQSKAERRAEVVKDASQARPADAPDPRSELDESLAGLVGGGGE